MFLFAFFSCKLQLDGVKRSMDPIETRKLTFRSHNSMYRLFTLAKTDAEICHAYLYVYMYLGSGISFL